MPPCAPHPDSPAHRPHRARRVGPARALAVAGGVVVALTLGLLATACGSTSNSDGRPTIVATTTIVGDLVRNVVGDAAHVEGLMPPGADPHDFEPSAAQAAKLRRASLIVESGLGLEQRLQPSIDAAHRDGVLVLALGDELDPEPLADDPSVIDPHWWLDPNRMARAAMLVATRVADTTHADDATATTMIGNAKTFADDAVRAATEVTATLSAIPADHRLLITNHDALGYFARRFGLTVEGVVIPGGSTLAEPSAADIAHLVDVLKASGVRAVFTESTTSSKLPSSIARAAGGDVRVIELTTDTLGGPSQPTSTSSGMITELARRIADGLTNP